MGEMHQLLGTVHHRGNQGSNLKQKTWRTQLAGQLIADPSLIRFLMLSRTTCLGNGAIHGDNHQKPIPITSTDNQESTPKTCSKANQFLENYKIWSMTSSILHYPQSSSSKRPVLSKYTNGQFMFIDSHWPSVCGGCQKSSGRPWLFTTQSRAMTTFPLQ